TGVQTCALPIFRLDDDLELGDLAFLEGPAEVLQGAASRAAPVLRLALQPLPLLGDLPRLVGVRDDQERVARGGHTLEAEDLHRHRGAGRLDRLAALIAHGAHPAGELAADEVVALGEGAA